MNRNLFATVLTYPAPSSNYRGESEENRTVLQKITRDGKEYPVISPESMRNALREIIAKTQPFNRSRLHQEDQLAVAFKEFPNADIYADDFLFGFLVTNKKEVGKNKDKDAKRDSVLRMNIAVATTPYRFNALFNQSPRSPMSEAEKTQLIHREVAHVAYQYPFALAYEDCSKGDGLKWTRTLLESIGQLSNVAGGHARSYFEMSPASIVARLTPQLVAGFNTYGFDEHGAFQELKRINKNDLPGAEFWIGGEIVRNMTAEESKRLKDAGAHLYENPQRLLADVADEFLGAKKQ
ncbi:MAG: type I-B CRISPR-associated protein Cas7/Cst2/DevR [Acidobacteria bacterium]|nr:type I-B CRISPR-associated protein Cas7/Cst2/DevR [Acidobacteriota bacterium]MCA1626747.1 type I-B CRISPR-associated protein Cas7/Cst2/DevR [Acidobacteriota bacterium]